MGPQLGKRGWQWQPSWSVKLFAAESTPRRQLLGGNNDPLHRADADTRHFGAFIDTVAGSPQCANARLGRSVKFESPQGLTLCAGACEAGIYTLDDDGALELGEHPAHRQQSFAGSGR